MTAGAKIEKICLGNLDFKGCIECGGCDNTGVCILKDDMTPIYNKLKSADALVLASPVFFGGVTSQLKAMIDRCESEWIAKYVLKSSIQSRRLGAFICVSGYDKDIFFEKAKMPVEVFFKTMDINLFGELFFTGVNKPGDIKNIKGALEKAYKLGAKIAGAK